MFPLSLGFKAEVGSKAVGPPYVERAMELMFSDGYKVHTNVCEYDVEPSGIRF